MKNFDALMAANRILPTFKKWRKVGVELVNESATERMDGAVAREAETITKGPKRSKTTKSNKQSKGT